MTQALLQTLEARRRQFDAELLTSTDGARDALHRLAHRADQELERVERRDAARIQKLEARIDPEKIAGHLSGRDYNALHRRELSFAVQRFWLFAPAVIEDLLKARGDLWSRFLTSMLRHWGIWEQTVEPRVWDRFAGLAKAATDDVWPVDRLPVQRAYLVTRAGPSALVDHSRDKTLEKLIERLRRLGVRPGWSIRGYIVIEWFRRASRRRTAAGDDLRFLLGDEDIRSQLLPSGTAGHAGSREMQVALVAALLGCRHEGAIKNEEFIQVQDVLFSARSIFGDPRVAGEGTAWDSVRKQDEPAYEDFLQGLIRDDLSFFFRHAMNDGQRGDFWLRYLRSIRRTVCFLSSEEHRAISRRADAQTPEVRAAMSRARRLRGHVSVFCLYFDDFVVVEFSDKGFAVYLYARDVFERQILNQAAEEAPDLRRPEVKLDKWGHHEGWQRRFDDRLLSLGVTRDAIGNTIPSWASAHSTPRR